MPSLIDAFVAKHEVNSAIDRFLGAWADCAIDSLDHRERLRPAW